MGIFRIVVSLSAVFVGVLGVASARAIWIEHVGFTPPRLDPGPIPAGDEFPGIRDASFSAADGTPLRGWFSPSRNGAVIVLAHGYGANRTQLLPEASALAATGLGILVFDFRAHGTSGAERTTFGDLERQDVSAAVSYALAQPGSVPGRLGILGFSAGAPPVAMVAAADARISAVVLEACTTSMRDAARDEEGTLSFFVLPVVTTYLELSGIDVNGVSPVTAVSRIAPRPLLVVQGGRDWVTPPERGRTLAEAARAPKELYFLPSSGHGNYVDSAGPAYLTKLVTFFDRALAKP